MVKVRAWSKEHKSYVKEIIAIYPEVTDSVRCMGISGDEKVFSDVILEKFTGFPDKEGTPVYEGDIVLFQGHEYPIKYFPKWGMFGLSGSSIYKVDSPDDPVGSGGSSTRYKPYMLGTYYQKRMKVIGNIHEK